MTLFKTNLRMEMRQEGQKVVAERSDAASLEWVGAHAIVTLKTDQRVAWRSDGASPLPAK